MQYGSNFEERIDYKHSVLISKCIDLFPIQYDDSILIPKRVLAAKKHSIMHYNDFPISQ